MISIIIPVLPGEAQSVCSQCCNHCSGPTSKLIDKFGVAFTDATAGKQIDETVMTILAFGKGDEEWCNIQFTIDTKELNTNHRWAIVDRAICVAKKQQPELSADDITSVLVFIPEVGDPVQEVDDV